MKIKMGIAWSIGLFLVSCTNIIDTTNGEEANLSVDVPTIDSIITTTQNQYAWTQNYQITDALINRIAVPEGYKRTKIEKGSFGDWLRFVPLMPEGSKVYYHNGKAKHTQKVHEAVLNIDVGEKDLQQCADAVIRLKAEYHYSKSDWSSIHFNFTSGDKVSFEDWRKGRKPQIKGNNVVFTGYSGRENNAYSNFKNYLTKIYTYAGTASLSKELKPVKVENMKIGDVFIKGGFPGHAVLVMDMAENGKGEKLFLLAQSYMPAQNIHVLKNFKGERELGAWYALDFGTILYTPEWKFTKDDLMRFGE